MNVMMEINKKKRIDFYNYFIVLENNIIPE